jgi:regulator of nucleoside diphosphate kinase
MLEHQTTQSSTMQHLENELARAEVVDPENIPKMWSP